MTSMVPMNRLAYYVASAFSLSAVLFLTACGPDASDTDPSPSPAAGSADQRTIDVAELGYAHGDPDAPVHVIEFSDFGCPHCATFAEESYPVLHDEFVESGQVYWQYIPFVIGTFPNGDDAARAAECAGEQGPDSFWAMHDRIFENQDAWKATTRPDTLFEELARESGIDVETLASCIDEGRQDERLWANNYVASQLGIRGTPSFLINGMPVQGAPPLDQFREFLHEIQPQ